MSKHCFRLFYAIVCYFILICLQNTEYNNKKYLHKMTALIAAATFSPRVSSDISVGFQGVECSDLQ